MHRTQPDPGHREDPRPGIEVWIDPLSNDFDYDEPVDSPRSWWFQFLAWVGIAVLGYVGTHTASRRGADWSFMVIGVLIAGLLVPTIRRGTIDISRYGSSTKGVGVYRRSADPVGFWTLIALIGILAGFLVLSSLADLLGMWSLWSALS